MLQRHRPLSADMGIATQDSDMQQLIDEASIVDGVMWHACFCAPPVANRHAGPVKTSSHDDDGPRQAVPLACAGAAVVATLLDQWVSHWPRFNLDLLLDISPQRPISHLVKQMDPSFVLSAPGESYDGPFYWANAVDPFARGTAHTLIDMPGYRYGHPLYSWIAAILSLGHATWLPVVFWLMGLVCMGLAGWQVSSHARSMGASPWWGMAVAASPGLLFSASSDLTEALQLVLIVTVLRLWRSRTRRSPVLLAIVLVAACMSKEQLVLLPFSLAVDAVIQKVRFRTPLPWSLVVALAAGPVVLFAWLRYLHTVMTPEQLAYQAGNIGLPFSQFGELLTSATHMRILDTDSAQIGSTAPSLLVAMGVVLLLGAITGLRRTDALGIFATCQLALMTCLGWRTLLLPHENLRIPAVALVIALLSIAGRDSGKASTDGIFRAADRAPATVPRTAHEDAMPPA